VVLYLIRHGQTTGDVEERYGGSYDDHLTDLGRRQSRAVAETLAGAQLTAVYSSPLSRAKETAATIATSLGLPHEVLPDFRECDRYGILSGMVRREALQAHPQEVAKLANLQDTVTGAESYANFRRRVEKAFELLHRRILNRPAALVTHGGVFRLLFREILELGETSIDDCAVARLQTASDGFRAVELRGIAMQGARHT
jgi:broad specificity phosphatase PhoE